MHRSLRTLRLLPASTFRRTTALYSTSANFTSAYHTSFKGTSIRYLDQSNRASPRSGLADPHTACYEHCCAAGSIVITEFNKSFTEVKEMYFHKMPQMPPAPTSTCTGPCINAPMVSPNFGKKLNVY